jgi:hypothetical protein
VIVEYSLLIHAPVSDVYQISQDYDVRYEWDPFPEKIEILNGMSSVKPGAEVRVFAKSGLIMDVQFVQMNPPSVAAVQMTKGPIFIRNFAGSWVFRADGSASTLAKFRYSIKLKFWTFPFFSERFAAFYFKKIVIARMQGLKNYSEARHRGY